MKSTLSTNTILPLVGFNKLLGTYMLERLLLVAGFCPKIFDDDLSGLAAGLDPTASHFAGVPLAADFLFPCYTTQRDARPFTGHGMFTTELVGTLA